jgi:predicted  nucleic acid-binding Zn-ribbon protein
VARLIAERDRLDDELRAAEREIARVHEHNAELGRHIDAQARQLERLRVGLTGTLRRLRARLLRR